ncbi:MAG: PfkB family carbohydrate kinase, partial [Thermoflexales bacterium]|nr:PfkB family carbohydrate kinase [Thermoflexales bacterium]
MTLAAPLDYLAIGHVTEDVWDDGRITLGGTVTYAALAARRMVPHVGVLTAGAPTLNLAEIFPALEVTLIPAPTTTRFQNRYTPQGRVQYTWPCPTRLTPDMLRPEHWRSRVLHLAPVCDEVDPQIALQAPTDVFVGVTPQGWLRRWDERGRVWAKDWEHAEAVWARANAAVISIEDVGGDWRQALRWAALARLFVVTQGAEGCTFFLNGRPQHVPAPRVVEVEPTGAGDIFAAALFIALAKQNPPDAACAFANCIAAQSVTRPYREGLPQPDEVARCC